MRRYALAFLLLCAPLGAHGAGFAPQSIFLSKSPVIEGDTVRIYAIVSNPSLEKFSGAVDIKNGAEDIGSVAVSLAAGATQTASVLWSPKAGSHAVVAQLRSDSGTVAEERRETFVVQEKPKPQAAPAPASTQTAAVESSQGIQDSINGISPQAGGVLSPVFDAIDGARESIADAATAQIDATKPKLSKSPLPGSVEGAETETPSSADWLWNIVYTLYFYVLTVVLFVVSSAAVFYPVLALAFLYLMWRMFRRFRRT